MRESRELYAKVARQLDYNLKLKHATAMQRGDMIVDDVLYHFHFRNLAEYNAMIDNESDDEADEITPSHNEHGPELWSIFKSAVQSFKTVQLSEEALRSIIELYTSWTISVKFGNYGVIDEKTQAMSDKAVTTTVRTNLLKVGVQLPAAGGRRSSKK